jgi:hypothetical protein
MKKRLHIGTDNARSPIYINSEDLTTHTVILGRTGSGKTGATVTTIEEAVLSGASVIALDPKGDLTNLALAFPELTSEEFAPWAEEGKDPAKIAAQARQELGHLAPNVKRWKESADVTIFAPGKTRGGGRGVNVLASFDAPKGHYSEHGLRDYAASLVSSVLSAIGHTADPMTDPANVYLTDITLDAWKNNEPAGLETWAAVLNNPPARLQTIDGLQLNDFFPKKRRMKIARSIVGFNRQAAKWLEGEAMKVENYVGVDKPKVSVFTLRHLDETGRQFFASMLLTSILGYMFRAPASNSLRLLVVLDEARGYLPPYPLNPPTKKPICTLLAQGRAQGIGMLIGTQNPNEMDYKALTNVGTWFLGGLRPRDCARDLKKELASKDVDTALLSEVPQRHFLILKKDGTHSVTKIRWAYSFLRGPINVDELLKLDESPQTSGTTGFFKADHYIGSNDLELCFEVANPSSEPVKIEVDYSTDGGRSWNPCSLRKQYELNATAPLGRYHTLPWNTIRDLGRNRVEGRLRLKANGKPLLTSAAFQVNNVKEKTGLLASIFG